MSLPPQIIRADSARPVLRFPCLLFATALLGAVLVPVVAFLAWPPGTLGKVLPGSVRIAVSAAAALAYYRFLYPSRTRLILDDTGLELRQPLRTRRVEWTELSGLFVTTFWEPTFRGGIAAGVRLSVGNGASLHIPDLFSIPRHELARLIQARRDSVTGARKGV